MEFLQELLNTTIKGDTIDELQLELATEYAQVDYLTETCRQPEEIRHHCARMAAICKKITEVIK